MKTPPWQAVHLVQSRIPNNLADWILYPGSFMQKMQERPIEMPHIRVLSQHWQLPTSGERGQLGMEFRTFALVREVLISSGALHWMYARTVFPRQTLVGGNLQLARLKNKSLGSVLFKDPALRRSDFELALLTPGMTLFEKAVKAAHLDCQPLWARRSLFTLQQKPLLLTEVFLPAMSQL